MNINSIMKEGIGLINAVLPNDREKFFSDGEFIVSKTDLKGRITYVNGVFMRISGFNEEQSLGQPHNLVRHPEMPKGVYYLLWKTLQKKQEFFGYVKNLCADGSYYWAFANITPDYDLQNQVIGYYSVRRPTPNTAKTTFESIYREMMNIENQCAAGQAAKVSSDYLLEHLDKQNTSYEQYVLSFIEGSSN